MNKNARKTLGALALTGAVSLGAFALLHTSVISGNSNKIAVTSTNEGNKPDAGDGDHNDSGARIGLLYEDSGAGLGNAINKTNALPETEAMAKAGTPYTFRITNTGTLKQVVRLNMAEKSKVDMDKGELPLDKVRVDIETKEGVEVFKGTLQDIVTAQNGVGKCFTMEGTTSKDFKLYAWIDESATETDLFGSDGTDAKSVQFKMGANGMQFDGVFTSSDEADADTLTQKFTENLNK